MKHLILRHCVCSLLLTLVTVGNAPLLAQMPTATAPATPSVRTDTAPASQPTVVQFQPGIRINWAQNQVEVEGDVILRRGPLELFACSPNTREHESIVRVNARPLHIFQALGLIGISPGHPTRQNVETGEIQPAAGGPVEILVEYREGGDTVRRPIEEWLRREENNKPLDRMPWVFAGSYLYPDGTFAADAEGTVVAVVDFGSALIALPESHSDRNDMLWLEPNEPEIPPIKTPCTVIFRPGPVLIHLAETGRIRLNGQAATLADIARTIQEARQDENFISVRITGDPDLPPHRLVTLSRLLRALEVPESSITVEEGLADADPPHDNAALQSWLSRFLTPSNPDATLATRPAQSPSPADLPRDLIDHLRDATSLARQVAERLEQTVSVADPSSQPGE